MSSRQAKDASDDDDKDRPYSEKSEPVPSKPAFDEGLSKITDYCLKAVAQATEILGQHATSSAGLQDIHAEF